MKIIHLSIILSVILMLTGFEAKQPLVITLQPGPGKMTHIIQQAIDSCGNAGGGKIVLTRGKYISGALFLRSNITLSLEEGAILEGSNNYLDYGEGRRKDAFLSGTNFKHITIEGQGLIDGADCYNPIGEEGFRGPHCIRLVNCENISIQGISIHRSANWAINCRYCKNAIIEDVTIRGGHDGLHTRFCENFSVEGCDFRTGDDCFAGNDNKNFYVENCKINSSCNGFRFGCYNFTVKNCTIWGPGEYKHISQKRNNMLSAFVHFSPENEKPEIKSGNWHIEDVRVEDVDQFYVYNYKNGLWQTGQPVTNVMFNKISAKNVKKAIFVMGDEQRLFDLKIRNSTFTKSSEDKNKKHVFEGITYQNSAFIDINQFDALEFCNVTIIDKAPDPSVFCKDGNMIILDPVSVNNEKSDHYIEFVNVNSVED